MQPPAEVALARHMQVRWPASTSFPGEGDCLAGVKELGLDLNSLSMVQRVLLVTDGTLTHILEAYADERMELAKLQHALVIDPVKRAEFGLEGDERGLRRVIVLCGSLSRMTYVYAESVVMLDRLPESVADGLLNTGTPIGKLLWKARAETLREITGMWQEEAGEVACHFGIAESDPVLSRSYQIVAGGRPIVLITEKFPRSAFVGPPTRRIPRPSLDWERWRPGNETAGKGRHGCNCP